MVSGNIIFSDFLDVFYNESMANKLDVNVHEFTTGWFLQSSIFLR